MAFGGLEMTFVASEKGKMMAKNCMTCTEVCKQAEMAHQIALGRMYATNELISILKKIENGELVEVVRCKDCKHFEFGKFCIFNYCPVTRKEDSFCSYGERRESGNHD